MFVEPPSMRAAVWQTLALAWIALTIVSIVGDVATSGSGASFGFKLAPFRNDTFAGRVVAVERDSPAERSGIAAGDSVSLADSSPAGRIRFLSPNAPGDSAVLTVKRGGTTRSVRLIAAIPDGAGPSLAEIAYEIIRLVFVIVAALIVIRRPDRRDARALAMFFIAFAFGFVAGPPWYPEGVRGLLDLARPLSVFFAFWQAVSFAAIFPDGGSGPRKSIAHFAAALFAFDAVVLIAILAPVFLWGARWLPGLHSLVVTASSFAFYLGAIVVCFALGYRDAPAAERPRVRWISLSIVVGLAGLVPAVIAQGLGHSTDDSNVLAVLPLTLSAIPLGTAYAMLRHRVLDIGFVVSRAVVFAVLSAIVLAAFTLLEWLLGRFLVARGHVASVVVEAVLALALGFSMQALHRRVDHVVDRTLFRERHDAEAALRRLAHEAPYVTDARLLAQRAIAAVERHAGALGATIYLEDGLGAYQCFDGSLPDEPDVLSSNDPAVVRLRAFRVPVNLHDTDLVADGTRLAGALGFALSVRGELTGVLVCGDKRSAEEYAPDEREVLDVLAHALATSFAGLRTAALSRTVDRVLAGDATIEDLRTATKLAQAGGIL